MKSYQCYGVKSTDTATDTRLSYQSADTSHECRRTAGDPQAAAFPYVCRA